uniref:Uncharacterized protein n=1 Tax=Magallana gigas TaxID=29159 RepID=A0A8W8I5W4_MAGGI|nr:uncharacterized protein LOC105341338 [Crassostrea gigas]
MEDELTDLLNFGTVCVFLFIILIAVIALCVHTKKAKVASSTRRDPKRHLRASANYKGKHRINSNRSIVSSVVSSNEDLASYYEVYTLIVPPTYNPTDMKTSGNLIEENENSGDIAKPCMQDQ